jgi:hypothetical protein
MYGIEPSDCMASGSLDPGEAPAGRTCGCLDPEDDHPKRFLSDEEFCGHQSAQSAKITVDGPKPVVHVQPFFPFLA